MAAQKRRTKKGASAPPVSSHPAFPAIVALWFAALLGLGSMILPVILLERLTVVTGLASLLPSAAPPLGFTARAILALAAALFGAVIGMLLARQVARSHEPEPRGFMAGDETKRRPISAHDELGEEGLAPSEEGFGKAAPRPQAVQKRRSLAIAEDNAKSEFLNTVPLPGQDAHDPDTAHAIDEQSIDDGALELVEFAESGDSAGPMDTEMTDGSEFSLPEDDFDEDEVGFAQTGERQEFRPVASAETNPFAALDPEADGVEDEDEAEPAEALPFAAPSLRRKVPVLEPRPDEDDEFEDDMPDFSLPTQRQASAPKAQATPVPQSFEPAAESPPQLSVVEPRDPSLAEALDVAPDDRDLDDLGLVQLAARLGASLERRRAQRAAQGTAAPGRQPIFGATEDFDAAAADDAARARADFFGGPSQDDEVDPEYGPEPASEDLAAAVPQAFAAPEPEEDEAQGEPFAAATLNAGFEYEEDEDEDADLAASFTLPLRKKPAATPSFAAPEEEEYAEEAGFEDGEEDDGSEDEYSSLLAMKNPFQRKQPEFVRIEEPDPAEDEIEATVTFPAPREESSPAAPRPSGDTRPFDPPPGTQPKGAPRDQGNADRELRAALETLQRMSGAA